MRGMRAKIVTIFVILSLPSIVNAEQRRRGGLRVQINSTPPGAAIFIDGDTESAGQTPAWVDLRRGTHPVRLVLEGHAPFEEEVDVQRAWVRFNYTLVALGRLELRAGDENAPGAAVSVDGQEVGAIPLSHEVEPGRHSFTVTREGFHPETRWFEVAGGQTYTIEMSLRALPPPLGELFVAADVSGAEILVDGQPAGMTPAIVEAAPGQHTVEIRAPDLEPHSETVTVEGGGRVTINAVLRPTRPPSGTLLVLTVPEGATVLVDGQEQGSSPATVGDLPTGSHIVEARADGHEGASERVEIEEGRQSSVRLLLQEIPRGGSVRVTSTVDAAEVLIDGQVVGRTPHIERGIEAGEHVLVVRASGHRDWERRLQIEPGVELLVEATHDAFGRVSVTTNVEGAEVVIDGEVVGPAPLEGHEIATGDHEVELRAEGRAPFRTSLTVEPGGTHHVNAQLSSSQPSQSEGEEVSADQESPPDRSGPRFTRTGFPVPPRSVFIDGAWGWPYLAGAYRIGVGIWDGVDWARLDVALEVRSSVWMTEIDAHLRFGMRFGRLFRLGIDLGVGGGVGRSFETTSENRAGFILNLVVTEGFVIQPVAFGLSQRLEVFIDTHGEQGNTGLVRQAGARAFVGGFVEWSVHRMFHIFVLADYAPVQVSRRTLCGSSWDSGAESCPHSWMRDINLNVQAGVGVRFN